MIGIKLSGGLGNQMFQYGFIVNISSHANTSFFLDKEGTPIELYKYFKLKKNTSYFIDTLFFNYTGYKLFFSHYLRRLFYHIIKLCFIKKHFKMSSNTEILQVQDLTYKNTLFEGYFQSPLYFNEKEVTKYFTLKDTVIKTYRTKFEFILRQKKIVVIHIRKTDYVQLGHLNLGGNDLSLPLIYYHQLIKRIHTEDNYYVFISDEPELISAEFSYLLNKFISKESAIIDFQHMLNADICIIANSTFSWWAAYLNKKKNKIVYCPRYFLGFKINKEYPVNIFPHNWLQITVPSII